MKPGMKSWFTKYQDMRKDTSINRYDISYQKVGSNHWETIDNQELYSGVGAKLIHHKSQSSKQNLGKE